MRSGRETPLQVILGDSPVRRRWRSCTSHHPACSQRWKAGRVLGQPLKSPLMYLAPEDPKTSCSVRCWSKSWVCWCARGQVAPAVDRHAQDVEARPTEAGCHDPASSVFPARPWEYKGVCWQVGDLSNTTPSAGSGTAWS